MRHATFVNDLARHSRNLFNLSLVDRHTEVRNDIFLKYALYLFSSPIVYPRFVHALYVTNSERKKWSFQVHIA